MADIRTITPNRPALLALALVAAMVAAGLLIMGVPRLFAALSAVDASTVVQSVKTGRPVSSDELDQALDSLDRAMAWHADGRTEAARGALLTEQALRAPNAAMRGDAMAQAEQAFVKSLTLIPAQAETWYRLAWLRNHAGNRQGAVDALRMSFLAGGFAPHLMVPRLELGLRLLPVMAEAERELLKRQIRLTWIGTPDALTAVSALPGGSDLIKQALDDLTEDEMSRFVLARGAK